jgi:hypothetical protein
MSNPFFVLVCVFSFFAVPLLQADLPGTEIFETHRARQRSSERVQSNNYNEDPLSKQHYSWMAPDIDEQLSRDRTLIAMGFGSLFIPTFTEGNLEPEAIIIGHEGSNYTTMFGQRLPLLPGEYDVKVGSGVIEQRLSYSVSIVEGQTTIIEPHWSGLVVETLNEEGSNIRESYEIYQMASGQSFGKGYGMDDDRIKNTRTWILPPGHYKITGSGEGFSSTRNFITIQLNPGELTQAIIVFETATNNLVAGGIKDFTTRNMGVKNWSHGLRAGGNISWNQSIYREKEEMNQLNVLTDIRYKARYDQVNFYGINEFFMSNNFVKEKGKRIRNINDQLKLRSVWVRRFLPWLGPYVRATLETHLLDQEQIAESTKYIQYHDYSKIVPANESYVFSPALSPLVLGEGAGLNIDFLTGYFLEMSLQSGLAARHEYSKGALKVVSRMNTDSLQEIQGGHRFGVELNYIARLRLWDKMTIDFRSEIFLVNGNYKRYTLDEFSMDARWNILPNMEIGYLYELQDQEKNSASTDIRARFRHINRVLIRVYFNY